VFNPAKLTVARFESGVFIEKKRSAVLVQVLIRFRHAPEAIGVGRRRGH
jgi:hypothetical protein